MSFKPSLRDVLPDRLQEPARAVLVSREELLAGTPWFVRALIGAGAWFASFFLMFFLALAVVVGKEVGAIIIGLIIIAGAIALRHQSPGVFLTQLLLASSLAGQGLVIGGMALLSKHSESQAAFVTVVLQTALLFLYPDTVQRFLSGLFASSALLILLRLVVPGVLVDVALVGVTLGIHLLFLHQGQLQATRWGELVTPAAFGLVLTLLWELVARTWGRDSLLELFGEKQFPLPPGVLTLGITAVTLSSVWHVLRELGAETRGSVGPAVLAALGLTAVLTLQTPGVITALGLMALGFHRRSALLLGMAVVFILVFGASYYYDIQLSLLAKSLALLGSGLVCLGARLFILRRLPALEEVA